MREPIGTMKVVYITSSSYSGSTMLSFLLNTHPDIFTVGEMDGWRYDPARPFPCSCGQPLPQCPLFLYLGRYFRDRGLAFEPSEFGTAYRVAATGRLNRALVGSLPRPFALSVLEDARDGVVWRMPPFAAQLRAIDERNRVFIEGALAYSGAKVFVDACKDPHRLHHLRRIEGIELFPVHLVRDLRGVVQSNLDLKKRGWDARVATRIWISDQCNIHRVLSRFSPSLQVFYEDICDDVDGRIAAIHRLAGLPPHAYPGSLKAREHHVLGNAMRLSNVTQIVKSEQWRERMSKDDLAAVESDAARFVRRHPRHAVSAMIERYLD